MPAEAQMLRPATVRQVGDLVVGAAELERKDWLLVLALQQHFGPQPRRQARMGRVATRCYIVDARLENALDIGLGHEPAGTGPGLTAASLVPSRSTAALRSCSFVTSFRSACERSTHALHGQLRRPFRRRCRLRRVQIPRDAPREHARRRLLAGRSEFVLQFVASLLRAPQHSRMPRVDAEHLRIACTGAWCGVSSVALPANRDRQSRRQAALRWPRNSSGPPGRPFLVNHLRTKVADRNAPVYLLTSRREPFMSESPTAHEPGRKFGLAGFGQRQDVMASPALLLHRTPHNRRRTAAVRCASTSMPHRNPSRASSIGTVGCAWRRQIHHRMRRRPLCHRFPVRDRTPPPRADPARRRRARAQRHQPGQNTLRSARRRECRSTVSAHRNRHRMEWHCAGATGRTAIRSMRAAPGAADGSCLASAQCRTFEHLGGAGLSTCVAGRAP